jgi:hypothetical protein
MRDENKNNSLCRGRKKRIGYVQQLEQELKYSKSYTGSGLLSRVSIPLETSFPAGWDRFSAAKFSAS